MQPTVYPPPCLQNTFERRHVWQAARSTQPRLKRLGLLAWDPCPVFLVSKVLFGVFCFRSCGSASTRSLSSHISRWVSWLDSNYHAGYFIIFGIRSCPSIAKNGNSGVALSRRHFVWCFFCYKWAIFRVTSWAPRSLTAGVRPSHLWWPQQDQANSSVAEMSMVGI